MVIACDTSFLFSLYASDAHSPRAVAWVSQNTLALHLNSLTHFDFGDCAPAAKSGVDLSLPLRPSDKEFRN